MQHVIVGNKIRYQRLLKHITKKDYYSYLSIATDSIRRNFNGIARDLILSNVLHSALGLFDYLVVDSVLNNKDISFETKLFQRMIEKEVKKYKSIADKKIEGINTYNDTSNDFISNLIQTKYKNKVVYIDIWATWCSPCLNEMAHSKILHKEFNNSNVVFLYLCTSSNENAWKKKINEKEIKGEHILLTDDQYSILRSQFNIQGVPWYLISDKNGKIINNASRPSSPETKKVLRKLLKE